MKIKLSKSDIINMTAAIVILIVVLLMFLVVGLRYKINNNNSLIIVGFGNYLPGNYATFNFFKEYSTISTGKDIYWSAIAIIGFSAFLVVSAGISIFVPKTKIMVQVGIYILNYLLLLVVVILSALVLTESMLITTNTDIRRTLVPSVISIIFLIVIVVLPLVGMGLFFNKTYFKMIYKMGK